MNKDQIEGNWKQIAGTLREKWGRLTGDETAIIAGIRERLEGCLLERHGYAKDPVHRALESERDGYSKTLDTRVDSAFGDLKKMLDPEPSISGSQLPI